MTAWRDIYRSTSIVTHPTFEVMSRSEAKLQLQVDDTTDDPLIDGLIVAGRQQLEHDTNRCLPPTILDLWFDRFPDERGIPLPKAPVSAVASVKSYDKDDVESTLDAANYFVDTHGEPARVVLRQDGAWPTELRLAANAGVIRFTGGYTGTAKAISAMARSGGTVTVTTAAAHGYVKGRRITIAGADQDDYNGTHVITVTGATTFTFSLASSQTPATPATGTMTATFLGIPEAFFQAMKLWMLHLYRPDAANDDLVRRVYDSLVTDALYAFG